MTNLLFLHGFATDRSVWDLQVKEFSKEHKLYFDIDYLNETDKSIIVIGWSLGGINAIDFYLKNKDRVKGLILVSAFPKFLQSDDYPIGLSPALLRSLEKKIDADHEHGLKFFYSLMFPDGKAHTLIRALKLPDRDAALRDLETLKNADIREKLPEIEVPTMIIHGSLDQIVPMDSAEYLAGHIKNSEMHIFEDVGHAPFLERPRYFNSILKSFIKRND